jgi:hypothetical protein
MTFILILLMSPAKDLRHIGKNLLVLRPEKGRLVGGRSGAMTPVKQLAWWASLVPVGVW